MKYKDYYTILGIPRTATAKEIKSAYRQLAKKYHPDINPQHADKFKDINEAFEVLGDEAKRQRYDTLGSHWQHGADFDPHQAWQGGGAAGWGGGFNVNDLFGQGGQVNFSDLFGSMFGNQGGMGGGYGQPQARPSAQPREELDQEQAIVISLEELVHGVERTIYSTNTQEHLTVRIPAGVEAGKKIRLKCQGRASRYGSGKRGDLLLVVQYAPHEVFTVEYPHLIVKPSLPVWSFVLGDCLTVHTLEGQAFELTLPEGSQPNQKRRLKGHGLPYKASASLLRGDLYVQPIVQIPNPEELSPQQRMLFEQLKQLAEPSPTPPTE